MCMRECSETNTSLNLLICSLCHISASGDSTCHIWKLPKAEERKEKTSYTSDFSSRDNTQGFAAQTSTTVGFQTWSLFYYCILIFVLLLKLNFFVIFFSYLTFSDAVIIII